MSPPGLARHGIPVNQDGVVRSAADLLAYPGMSVARLAAVWPELSRIPADIAGQLEIDAVYQGYLTRQQVDIDVLLLEELLHDGSERDLH